MSKPNHTPAEKVAYFQKQLADIRTALAVLKQFEGLSQTWLEKSEALAKKQG